MQTGEVEAKARLLKQYGFEPDDEIWLPDETVGKLAKDARPDQLARAKGRNLREAIPAGKGRFSAGDKGVEEYLGRIRSGQTCGMQSAISLHNAEHSGDPTRPATLIIAAGGPSLANNLGELRKLVKRGAKVIAVNKTHDYLVKRGIPVDYAALLDPKDWVADYIDPTLKESRSVRKEMGRGWVDTKYLIASQCHDLTINKFKRRKDSYLYHAAAGLGEKDVLKNEFKGQPWICITGGSVIGLRAINLGYGLGFRKFHTFGLDGSARMPPESEMSKLFTLLCQAGMCEWTKTEPPTQTEIVSAVFKLARGRKKFPDAANEIMRKYLYSYAKPHIDSTWSAFTIDLKTGWSRSYLANHHMARSVYEFEDSLREWDGNIRSGKMEPFNLVVHGDPEQSAIAMVAAGMGIHADAEQNAKHGKAPHEQAA